MKKLMTIAIMTLVPMVGFAKVSDFNSMITENTSAQSQLHTSVKANMGAARIAAKDKRKGTERIAVNEEAGDTYNSPTSKKALTFHKEKAQNVNQEADFERLATELNQADL